MHSALSFASILLAATGALAAPAPNAYPADTSVSVLLQSQSTETGSTTTFHSVNHRKEKSPVGSTGPFETIEIQVGAGAKQDLRCQALDIQGQPLVAIRNTSVDNTFSDADKGPWTFRQPSEVSRIICDPAFVKTTPETFEVRVELSGPGELATQTVFPNTEQRVEQPPTGSDGPFDTVQITVGELANPALRCKLLSSRGRPIVAERNGNVDTTFSDAKKGPWKFDRQHHVSKIVCNPAFVASPQ